MPRLHSRYHNVTSTTARFLRLQPITIWILGDEAQKLSMHTNFDVNPSPYASSLRSDARSRRQLERRKSSGDHDVEAIPAIMRANANDVVDVAPPLDRTLERAVVTMLKVK